MALPHIRALAPRHACHLGTSSVRSPARQQLSPRAVYGFLGLGPGQESPAKSCKTPGPSLAGAAPGGAPCVKASPGHRDALRGWKGEGGVSALTVRVSSM